MRAVVALAVAVLLRAGAAHAQRCVVASPRANVLGVEVQPPGAPPFRVDAYDAAVTVTLRAQGGDAPVHVEGAIEYDGRAAVRDVPLRLDVGAHDLSGVVDLASAADVRDAHAERDGVRLTLAAGRDVLVLATFPCDALGVALSVPAPPLPRGSPTIGRARGARDDTLEVRVGDTVVATIPDGDLDATWTMPPDPFEPDGSSWLLSSGDTEVRASPSGPAQVVVHVAAGVEVPGGATLGAWRQIRIAGSARVTGWVRSSALHRARDGMGYGRGDASFHPRGRPSPPLPGARRAHATLRVGAPVFALRGGRGPWATVRASTGAVVVAVGGDLWIGLVRIVGASGIPHGSDLEHARLARDDVTLGDDVATASRVTVPPATGGGTGDP